MPVMDIKNLEETFRFGDSHWWFLGRRRVVRNMISRFIKRQGVPVALDAGCGPAIVFGDLEQFCSPVGIDRSDAALGYAKERGAKKLVRGDVCALPFRNASFGLVTVLGVLYNEGVWDEAAALGEFARVLEKGGILIIDESAYNFLQSKYNTGWGGVRRYTRGRLKRLASARGFEILKSSYWSVAFFPIACLMVLLERFFNFRKGYRNIARMNSILNEALKNYLYMEASLLRHINFPFGTMVFVVARKA